MMLLSQARSIESIILLTCLTGLAGELYRPASSALLADLVPPGQRITAYAAYRLAFNAGWAFGPATAGFLAGHSFFWLFAGDALSSVLFGIVAWTALPHGVRSDKGEAGWSDALRLVSADRKFQRLLLASLIIALVFYQMSSTFGLYITQQGLSAATYGALISLNGVLVVLFELPLTTLTRRFPARRMMAIGYALIGIGFALNVFAQSALAFVGVVVVFTLGEMIAMPVSSAYIADLAPAGIRGRYMGAFGLTWAFALVWGPAVSMRVFAHSPSALWLSGGVLGLAAAFIILPRSEPQRS